MRIAGQAGADKVIGENDRSKFHTRFTGRSVKHAAAAAAAWTVTAGKSLERS